MSNYLGLTRHQLENEIDERDDELSHLRAELEALRPKPARIQVQYYYACNTLEVLGNTDAPENGDNLKLTFEDGKLVKAEVIKESEG